MKDEQQFSELEIKIMNEINDLDNSIFKILRTETAENILFKKKIKKPDSHISLGALFLNKIKNQSDASVKLGIPPNEIIHLTSGFKIKDEYMSQVMKEYGIKQKDIKDVINAEYKEHESYVDKVINILNKYNYEGLTKEDLLLDKSDFGFLEYNFSKYYQSVNDFQLLMSSLITDLQNASDDEYSLNYYPDYAERESLMWVLLRTFTNLTYDEIIEKSENKITKYQLATLECSHETEYDDTSIDRSLYFKILKDSFPGYIKTFKLMEYSESNKKAMFINIPILREDRNRLLNHMERLYCEKVLMDNTKMYLAKMSFIKK